MGQGTGIVRGRKFEQVREGAAVIFLRDGFAAASVDDIARSARVSKATLYSYFPDKRLMFQEVLANALDMAFDQPPFDAASKDDVGTALPKVLDQLARWLISDHRLRLHRIAIAEAPRFPELAVAYARAMEDGIVVPLTRLVQDWATRNEITVQDPALAARQLVALMGGQLRINALLSHEMLADSEIAEAVTSACALFLRAHAPRQV
ncbi:TetR/AcrR family transcriptional regulator [Paracoccus sp. (in: a-proteobacteria)]|uniref:TetR/AcrR family transcriptional regulator n=1 Tax=Paracoccus sp. TaxID=267 RepID=UPI00396C44CB